MKEVYILGAGFSRAVKQGMPLLEDLTIATQSYPEFNKYAKLGNIEEILSYLGQGFPWEDEADVLRKKADFIDLSRLIGAIINEAQGADPQFDNSLSKFIKTIHRNRPHILTMNYDTILEMAYSSVFEKVKMPDMYPITLAPALERGGGAFLGSLHEDGAKIYKLHGSINYYYSGASDFYGEQIYLSAWPARLKGNLEGLKNIADKIPLIVPPTFDKSHFFNNATIKVLWNLAGKMLQEAEVLTVVGYSLPVSDLMMRAFLKTNAINLKEVRVVDISDKVPRRFEEIGFEGNPKITPFVSLNGFRDYISTIVSAED